MEAKSLFSIRVFQRNEIQSSSCETAIFAFKLLEKLKEFDDIFSVVYYYHSDRKEKFIIDKKELDKLAKLMLKKEWYEITKFEDINNPTIEYKRKLDGFNCSFEVLVESKTAFQIGIGYGYKTNGINIYHFNKEIRFDYAWYERLFNTILQAESWLFGEINVSNNGVFDIYKDYNLEYPLGWLTYYSNDLNIKIPDLPNVKIESFQNGTLIKTDEIDFLADKESFDAYKVRLKLLLEMLKNANFSK